MKYNIYVKTFYTRYNLLNLSIEKIEKIIEAYKKGNSGITVTGKTYNFSKVNEFRIFENISGLEPDGIYNSANGKNKLSWTTQGSAVVEPQVLLDFGDEITDNLIGDVAYGSEQEKELPINNGAFINSSRIDELKSVKHADFDLAKLIQLCVELNHNFAVGNFLSVGMIGRAILDHVPPIFKMKNFNEVESNYAGGKSFKKNMEHLNNSLRSIADSYLHLPIRSSETLPTITQVDFKQNMDVMLAEVVRLLK